MIETVLPDTIAGISLSTLKLPVLGQLILASILGGAIGLEREVSGKEAGLRTNILICVGATLLTILSLKVGHYAFYDVGRVIADPSRLMAAIISGIGFLGAGTIIQARGNITGLTTAATLWVVAAIGIAIGAGVYIISIGTTVFVLATLIPLGYVEDRFLELPHHWVKAEVGNDLSVVEGLIEDVEGYGFEIKSTDINRGEENHYEILLKIQGKEAALSKLPGLAESQPELEVLNIIPDQ